MSKKQQLPGMFDIMPDDDKEPWRSSHLWQLLEKRIASVTTDFGYREVRTPILERSELFERNVGQSSDIVNKEMYTFEDRGGRMVSLRPEGTAPALRAFIESNLSQQGGTHRLFYTGPMFRYERSQAGRYRQHHQFGVEAIGSASPEQDVEVIALIMTVYRRLGLRDWTLYINTLGSDNERARYRDALKAYLEKYRSSLSEESVKRLDVNPMRILDSKAAEDREIVAGAPSILDALGSESLGHFDQVQELLTTIGLPYSVAPTLVRGLDYYNGTVFEVTAEALGAHNSLCGGGRYDGLMKKMGGPDLPAIGFGCGMERVIQTLLNQVVELPAAAAPALFLIPLDATARRRCFELLYTLHEKGVSAQMDYSGRKLNKVMQHANQLRARYVAVIGDREVNSGEVALKQMATGDSRTVPIDAIAAILELEKQKGALNEALSPLWGYTEGDEERTLFIQELTQELNQTQQVTQNLQQAIREISDMLEPPQSS